jgi:dipeptidyl aminopeptidase/acylaminoacyl peptidase
LLGGGPEDKPDLARLASPVFHVDAGDPPLLLIHGDQDPQAPINQSHELEGKYRAAGVACRLEVVHGGKHGGEEFFDSQRCKLVREFLAENLAPAPSSQSP